MRDHGMRAQPGLVRSAPFNGMTVSDHGRVTVIRDTTGSIWNTGLAINDLFSGLSGSMDAYYATHPDGDPQFVMVVQDWLNTGLLGAFYNLVANDVSGIGYRNSGGPEIFDNDSSTALEGYIWMNGIQLF